MVYGNTWHRGTEQKGLDQCLINKPEKLSPVETIWTGLSDHALLKTHRWSKTVPAQARYIKMRCFKNFKQEEFKRKLKEMPELEEIKTTGLLNNVISKILDKLAPLKTIPNRTNYAPHISEETKRLQQQRKIAQTSAAVAGNTEDARCYRSLRNQALASLRRDKTRWEKERLSC